MKLIPLIPNAKDTGTNDVISLAASQPLFGGHRYLLVIGDIAELV